MGICKREGCNENGKINGYCLSHMQDFTPVRHPEPPPKPMSEAELEYNHRFNRKGMRRASGRVSVPQRAEDRDRARG